ncbi:hypothetical protein FB451DRAFT_1191629 [Mycena latifolia]|nr:hypothetical protein FB451DRAFT_1191629 [Mycena latifolia]
MHIPASNCMVPPPPGAAAVRVVDSDRGDTIRDSTPRTCVSAIRDLGPLPSLRARARHGDSGVRAPSIRICAAPSTHVHIWSPRIRSASWRIVTSPPADDHAGPTDIDDRCCGRDPSIARGMPAWGAATYTAHRVGAYALRLDAGKASDAACKESGSSHIRLQRRGAGREYARGGGHGRRRWIWSTHLKQCGTAKFCVQFPTEIPREVPWWAGSLPIGNIVDQSVAMRSPAAVHASSGCTFTPSIPVFLLTNVGSVSESAVLQNHPASMSNTPVHFSLPKSCGCRTMNSGKAFELRRFP